MSPIKITIDQNMSKTWSIAESMNCLIKICQALHGRSMNSAKSAAGINPENG